MQAIKVVAETLKAMDERLKAVETFVANGAKERQAVIEKLGGKGGLLDGLFGKKE